MLPSAGHVPVHFGAANRRCPPRNALPTRSAYGMPWRVGRSAVRSGLRRCSMSEFVRKRFGWNLQSIKCTTCGRAGA